MREIKFRQPLFHYGTFRSFHYWGFLDEGFIGPETHYVTLPEAKLTSQQFTSLRDKHDIEIYEGDIIIDPELPELIGKVIFYPSYGWSGYWKYRYPSKSERKDFFSTGTIADHRFRNGNWYWETGVEVIGNIHEHEHLLTETHKD